MLPGMNGRSRAEAALLLEEPDMLPIGSFGVPPLITSKIIGRTPYYRNTPLCWDAIAEGKVDYVNRRIAEDQLDLYRKLKVEWIRVYPNAYPKSTRVEKVGGNVWRVNGSLRRWVPQTNMDWPLERGKPRSDEEVIASIEARIRYGPKPEEIADTTIDDSYLYPIRLLKKELGDQALIFGGASGTIGGEDVDLLRWLYRYPDFIRSYLRYRTDIAIESAKRQVEAGADGIVNGADYAYKNGPFMSPKIFKEIILPELRREVQAFKRMGAFVILHSDGNIKPLLEHIVESGVDGIQSLDPQAGIDIGEIKELYGDRICLVGNICLRTLNVGSLEDVARETIECIRKASPGGGHILTTANVVDVGVKFENFMKMIEVARKYGKYRI
ncbi:MAG: uroporphyrinogen decarboxylase family protein [Candidatus Bathyarchaeota archaeon]|nr:uroporphyrinogen decarboxylase family protein [Candidatus Bathyarchaeota archaeon]